MTDDHDHGDHDDDHLWWDSCYDDFDPDWDELRSRQSDFAVLRALANTAVEHYREPTFDADLPDEPTALARRYGPMWRYAQLVWLPPVSTYDYDDACMSWQTSQSAVLVRSDLVPMPHSDRCDEPALLSASVRQAVGEALQVWAQQRSIPVETIAALLDDFDEALHRIPAAHLWEAGVVPAIVHGRVRMMRLDRARPWLPSTFRAYSRDASPGDTSAA